MSIKDIRPPEATPTKQEYRLLDATSAYGLDSVVNNHLARGWKLYGNPIMAYDNHHSKFAQAMIRIIPVPVEGKTL